MIDKRTVFVLGAGASCPYGYPSGALLRKSICLPQKFSSKYSKYESRINESVQNTNRIGAEEINEFRIKFEKSSIKSIDLFMANNPKLASIGKYIIAFEIFSAEKESKFREEGKLWQELSRNSPPRTWKSTDRILRKDDYQGEDWYSYLYNHLIEGLIGKDVLPNFSDDKIAFITFNYDRSLEHFIYESLRYSFNEVEERQILDFIDKFKIFHVYGKIAPLKWEDPENGVDYCQEIDEELLQKASANIKTIYEQTTSDEIKKQAIFLPRLNVYFFLVLAMHQRI